MTDSPGGRVPRRYEQIWEHTIKRCLKGDARPVRIYVKNCNDLLAQRIRKAVWKEKDLDKLHSKAYGIKIKRHKRQRVANVDEPVDVFEFIAFPRKWEDRI